METVATKTPTVPAIPRIATAAEAHLSFTLRKL
jgi:hypothetical protein